MGFDLEKFADGYIETALWADCIPPESDPEGETGGREGFELREGVRETIIERGMLADFIQHNESDLLAYCEARDFDPSQGTAEEYAGHDFWLTRNGHGAGFWDRGLGELGDRLTAAAKGYGSADDHTPYDCGDGTVAV